MGRLSAKLRSLQWGDGGSAIGFWCPGCNGLHIVVVKKPTGSVWQWDGNVDVPTISPSILVSGSGDNGVCHSFVKAGQIEFLGDCTHALKSQTVPIPDWPYAEGEYGGV
jgi:hypothetical protein